MNLKIFHKVLNRVSFDWYSKEKRVGTSKSTERVKTITVKIRGSKSPGLLQQKLKREREYGCRLDGG